MIGTILVVQLQLGTKIKAWNFSLVSQREVQFKLVVGRKRSQERTAFSEAQLQPPGARQRAESFEARYEFVDLGGEAVHG